MKTEKRKKFDEVKKNVCKNLIVVLENPKNIQNVAACLRNINTLGAEKLYVVDGYNLFPEDDWQDIRDRINLNKQSVSASKWTYLKKFSSTEECVKHLDKKNFRSCCTSPHIKGRDNRVLGDDADFTQKKIAIWFGNESSGISTEAVDNSLFCVQIPMYGVVESLNLGTSSGIVLFEATNQRRKFSK